ncbi:glycine-rich RNA-binding protein RZ1A-like [Salvia miltiorrhiza]|uniref:glycine-rich RNA-binding protein RZ1A-like n=1 Tax=Salvia miltiorrhiza TaxID=226208 RepID=UPI0025AB7CAB|nr:glycine-rich RNA-binding protein RZ1A-like [Salvia miltiorrhiza]XP_057808308.1 glycine-rich RNA-binding protein RZ1A-like [Salvia miltiorrhiza]
MGKKKFTLNELLNELVAAEGVMGKSPQALATATGPSFPPKGRKKKGPHGKKGQEKGGSKKKPGPTGGIKKPKGKGKCFKCQKTGHWKSDCPMMKKAQGVPADKGA